MTFLATRGCASDFLKMLPNFKMATRGQLQIFLCVQKQRQKLFKFYDHIPHVEAKTEKLCQNIFKFYYHIPHHMEISRLGTCVNMKLGFGRFLYM